MTSRPPEGPRTTHLQQSPFQLTSQLTDIHVIWVWKWYSFQSRKPLSSTTCCFQYLTNWSICSTESYIFIFVGCILLRYTITLSKYTCNRNWDSCHFIPVYSQHVSAPTDHLQVKYNITYTFRSTINAATDPLLFDCHLSVWVDIRWLTPIGVNLNI
jgi:hypothetical protein